jgi:transposase InsO family protein
MKKNYVKSTPQITAENILDREFQADRFGEKWLTDVTEMKYGSDSKAYLSAILDLGDKSTVSFVLGHSNNNVLVFRTFDIAHQEYPDYSYANQAPVLTTFGICSCLIRHSILRHSAHVPVLFGIHS